MITSSSCSSSRQPDGGQQCEEGEEEKQQQAKKPTSRTLVYDVETGSLRFSKPRTAAAAAACNRSPLLHPKSPAIATPSPPSLDAATDGGQDGCLSVSKHGLLHRLQSEEDGSGDSSPTCVIRNSALRSNSSSPTMSTMSKASSEMDSSRQLDYLEGGGRGARAKCGVGGNSPSDADDEAFLVSASPGSETQVKIGGVRGSKKLGSNSLGRPLLKGALSQQGPEKESSSAKENGWATALPDVVGRGEVKESSQTAPFKAIQSAMADRTTEEVATKKKHGGIPSSGVAPTLRPSPQSASVMSGMPGIFSFNATYMSRATDCELYDYDQSGDPVAGSAASFDFNRAAGAHRAAVMGPLLLKPTPSKWDDAEKWLVGSDIPVRAKARSGPLLAQMVANQAGMGFPRKGPLSGLIGRHSGPQPGGAAGVAPAAVVTRDAEAENSAVEGDVKSINTPKLSMVQALQEFGADEKQQLSMLLDRYSLGDLPSQDAGNAKDGNMSPSSCKGSFLKIAARAGKPATESPPTIDGNLRKQDPVLKTSFNSPTTASLRTVSMRDMGTAMTPIPSVEPSRTATPLRATTPDKSPIGSRVATPERAFGGVKSNRGSAAETPRARALTGKELQAKTRQEILALGTQLGKANIAAWATKDDMGCDVATALKSSTLTLDLEEIRRTVLASRVTTWEEAEKAKYTSRFEREEAKIQAWENHEKAKAEAEMRRIEVKVERMRSHAHEKLMNKLAAARRQAEELRAAAEARRAEAAAKTAKRAEVLKKTGKVPSLLLFTLLCT